MLPNTYSLHLSFEKAFDYINQNDLLALPDGIAAIVHDLKVIVHTGIGRTKEASLLTFECDDRTIDIKICVKGFETFGWGQERVVSDKMERIIPKKRFFYDVSDIFFN